MTKKLLNQTISKWSAEESRAAIFSPCRQWRYHLQHIWDETRPNLLWLMLNPSTADEKQNDPTVERCERRARMWGYGGVEVYNIFAYRATNPSDMKAQKDPVGLENDDWIVKFAKKSRDTTALIGWGEHGKHRGRGKCVLQLLKENNATISALKINASGHPKHPLYIGYKTQPTPYDLNAVMPEV